MQVDGLVWAYKKLDALDGQTGFVTCDAKVAKALIKKGDAQDPQDGALHLHPIEGDAPDYVYETKVMEPEEKQEARKPRRKKKATKDETE